MVCNSEAVSLHRKCGCFLLIATMNFTIHEHTRKDKEIPKGVVHTIDELAEYRYNQVVTASIIKKETGYIKVVAIASGEWLAETTDSYDTFVQIIEGIAHIEIDGQRITLKAGECIVIPANKPSHTIPDGPVKLVQTGLKSNF